MGMHSNASLAEPIDRVAASEQIKILQQLALQAGAAYYEGGFGRMLGDIADAFVDNGGDLRTGVTVERIDIDDGVVRGITTSAGTFTAPAVVSAVGIQPTILKLAGAEQLPRRVRGVRPQPRARLGLGEHPLLPVTPRPRRPDGDDLLRRHLVHHRALRPTPPRRMGRRRHRLLHDPRQPRPHDGTPRQAVHRQRIGLLPRPRSRRDRGDLPAHRRHDDQDLPRGHGSRRVPRHRRPPRSLRAHPRLRWCREQEASASASARSSASAAP